MNYARQVFDTILEPNVFIWNTMIKGCSRINCPKFAVSLYIEMLEKNVKPDDYTFPFLLKGFTPDIVLECGGGIHCHVCKFGFDSNGSVKNALIHMYSLCGQIDIARGVFNLSLKCDVITWNCMISGYNRSKQFDESRKLFNEMEETSVVPTSATLVSLLSACSKLKDLDAGIRVHRCIQDHMIEPNLVLNNAVVDMYASCGDMDTGLAVFKTMNTRDVISWTAIVKGFLSAGQVDLAREYFELMPQKDSVSWTAMIDGYLRLNRFKEVLILFRDMQDAKVEPDEFTMVSVLTACANLGALELGEWIKAYIDKNNIKNDVYIGNALIDMYFKCGNVEKAVEVFKVMLRRDKFTWTAMIVGFAVNGNGKEAVDMFCKMLSASIKPDRICYIGVLCACAHAGMVEEGRNFFTSMTIQCGIEPEIEHYGCLIDLLGRAGRLTEAYKVIENMPMKPNSVVWGALLGACRIHKDLEMAEIAATELLHLEPGNGAVCILLCNIYAACNRWDNLLELRKMMADRGIEKTAGCSVIEINGFIHEFVAWDQSHFRSEEIYSKLEMMREDMRTAGYTPDTSEVFPGLGEEYKEGALNFFPYFRHEHHLYGKC